MTRCGVEQLVALDLLRELAQPFLEVHYGSRQISTSSIDDLEKRIIASASGKGGER